MDEETPEEAKLRARHEDANAEIWKVLNRILRQNPEGLTAEDRGFLFARRDLLNNEQLRVFGGVIEEEQAKAEAYMASLEADKPEVKADKKK